MKKQLPPIKSRPEAIPFLLKKISDNDGNYAAMSDSIYDFLCSASKRKKKPTKKNSVRAVALPTLRHLYLIDGFGDDTILTARGRVLLSKSLEERGNILDYCFRKAFAEYLLRLEREYYIPVSDIVYKISNISQKQTINIFNLMNTISMEYGESFVNKNRLMRWLGYLKYVGFIEDIGETDIFHVNKHQIKAAELSEAKINETEFKKILIDEYHKLAFSDGALGYVPIPKLRYNASISFDGRLWDEDFDRLLREMKKEDEEHIIGFSEPMSRKAGGFHMNERYYYYIIMRDKK